MSIRRKKDDKQQKVGHLRVDGAGTVSFKKTPADELAAGFRLGLHHFVGKISAKPVGDVLYQDFHVVESKQFPSAGSPGTVAHSGSDFVFECYAPEGFRFFREAFGLNAADFLMSLCGAELKSLSNAGASGSIFFLSADDDFIVKTVDSKEAKFLLKLLPGYYMNLVQNPRTLLPKFFGHFCYQTLNKNIRFVVMNNLLPSTLEMHEKFDLKGSTFKRKASKAERRKSRPTLKDLDFLAIHPKGLKLGAAYRKAILETVERDCRVLESFGIMDFSLLLGIHNLDKVEEARKSVRSLEGEERDVDERVGVGGGDSPDASVMFLRQNSKRTNRFTAFEVVQNVIANDEEFADYDLFTEVDEEMLKLTGGIPARNAQGERLLLFVGIIDILQRYKMFKKMEHAWKSTFYDEKTISVTNPSFYKRRFSDFLAAKVFPFYPRGASLAKKKTTTTTTLSRKISTMSDGRDSRLSSTKVSEADYKSGRGAEGDASKDTNLTAGRDAGADLAGSESSVASGFGSRIERNLPSIAGVESISDDRIDDPNDVYLEIRPNRISADVDESGFDLDQSKRDVEKIHQPPTPIVKSTIDDVDDSPLQPEEKSSNLDDVNQNLNQQKTRGSSGGGAAEQSCGELKTKEEKVKIVQLESTTMTTTTDTFTPDSSVYEKIVGDDDDDDDDDDVDEKDDIANSDFNAYEDVRRDSRHTENADTSVENVVDESVEKVGDVGKFEDNNDSVVTDDVTWL